MAGEDGAGRGRRRPVVGGQDEHDVRVGPLAGRGLVRGHLDDPLAGQAEPLADDQHPVGAAGERSAELGGPAALVGQHGDLGLRARDGQRLAGVAAVRRDHDGVVPLEPGAAERQRDARQPRQHLDRPRGDGAAHGAHDAEESRIAGGEHDDLAGLVGDGPQRGPRVVAERDGAHALGQLDLAQVAASAHDERRRGQALVRAGGQRAAVVADDGDHVPTQAGSVAATTPAPAGSTIATRAARPLKRVSTSATRPHSRSPAGRSSPASSHSS